MLFKSDPDKTQRVLLFVLLLAVGSFRVEKVAGQDPPWLDGGSGSGLPAVAITNPLDALVDIGPTDFERFEDGMAVEPENELVLKLLMRIPAVSLAIIERFAAQNAEIPVRRILDSPNSHRGEVFLLAGQARWIIPVGIQESTAERFEFSGYYRVLLEMESNQTPVWIVTRAVPKSWQKNQLIDEPTRLHGYFVGFDNTSRPSEFNRPTESGLQAIKETPLALFVSGRMAWLPGQDDQRVTEGVRWLVAQGFDASLFQDVAERERAKLGAQDSESFFQALAAIRRGQDSPPTSVAAQVDTLALMREPDRYRGERIQIEGNIRRITRVEVADPYFAERLQIDHYFQIDLFVRLKDNQVVRMGANDEGEAPTFQGKYPYTICVASLPSDLKPTEDINLKATIEGFFYRLWAYPSLYVEQFDADARQVGPLFVGHRIEIQETSGSPAILTFIAAGVLVISLAAAWFGAWALGRQGAVASVDTREETSPGDFLQALERGEMDVASSEESES